MIKVSGELYFLKSNLSRYLKCVSTSYYEGNKKSVFNHEETFKGVLNTNKSQ